MKWKKKTRPLVNDTRTIKQRFVSNGSDLQYWYNDEVVG